jgi:hypothetical protein
LHPPRERDILSRFECLWTVRVLMLPELVPYVMTATERTVIYAGCMSSVLVAAFLFSIHGRLQAPKSIPSERGNSTHKEIRPGLIAGYGKLPLSFEANQGQADARVKFLSHERGYGLFLKGDEAVLEVQASGFGIQGSGSVFSRSRGMTGLQRTTDHGRAPYSKIQNPKSKMSLFACASWARSQRPK